jgi:hypothetical protein
MTDTSHLFDHNRPASTFVTRQSLGDFADRDPIASVAISAGLTESQLIQVLLQERAELLKHVNVLLTSRQLPPILLNQ